MTPDGKLVELEQDLHEGEVPANVRAYTVKYFVDTADASLVKLLAGYRARGMIWGQEMFLYFAPDGTFVRDEEGEREEQ